MKKFSIRALSLVLCLAMLVGYIVLPDVPAVQAETERTTTTTTATNPNLITNGTFEKVLADGTVQPNIQGWGLASSKVWSVAADPDKANNFVLELADNSTTASGSAVFTFTPEVGLYKLTIEYKTDSKPELYVRGNATSSAGIQLLHHTFEKTNGEWKTFETIIEVTEEISNLNIMLSTRSVWQNTGYFDNLSFVKITDDDNADQEVIYGQNLIPNSTFGDTAANTDSWTSLNTSKLWSVVEDPDKAGNFVLQVKDDSTTAGGYVYAQITPEPGLYRLTVDYKTDTKPELYVRGNNPASSGIQLLHYIFVKTSGEWKTYEALVEVSEEITNLYILMNTRSAFINEGYFDNITFARVEETEDDDSGITGGEMLDPSEEIVIPEQNILANPYFELTVYDYTTPFDATTAPKGWTLETTGTGVQLYKSSGAVYDGKWAVLAVDNSMTGSFKLSAKVENIQGGAEYKYVFARTGSGTPQMAVRYYDANGTLLAEFVNARSGYKDWQESDVQTAKAPEGTSYAIVSLESTTTKKCNVYLDALSFYAADDEAKTNLLPNASFEEFPESLVDVLISSRNESTTAGWTIGNMITLEKTETEEDKAAVGNYMIHLTDESDKGGPNMYYTVDVVPGTTYTFSCMVRGQFTVGSPIFRFAYYQDEACTIPAQIGTSNVKNRAVVCTDTWTRASFGVEAPANAVKLRVYFLSSVSYVGEAYAGNFALVKGVPSKFDNLDFEDLDASGAVESWNSYKDGKLAASTKDPFAGKISLQIKDNSQAVQQGTISEMVDLSGYQIPGYAVDQMTYTVTARVKDAKKVKGQLSIIYFDHNFKECAKDSITSAGTGKWQFLVLNSKMPKSAAYAKILLAVGDKVETTGTIYLDDITVVGEYGQYIEEAYDYKIKYTEGNRLYFTEEELEAIREFALDDTLNAFGTSGANAYRALIRVADTYVMEDYYMVGWDESPDGDRVTSYRIDLNHIQDISADPLLADVPGGRNWPYLESIAIGLRTRFQTVALAYAITGDTKYSDQAISWALDMCEWEYWCETKYCWPSYNGTLDNPRIIIGMAAIYDMCYDQMTQEQRDLIAENIIYKGLKPLYMDLTGPDRQNWHNKFMNRCASLFIGSLAVINEENKDEVGKYLDRAYNFAKTFLDIRYTETENEGYMYTSVSIEELVAGMDCMLRVTGREGLLNHPYFSEVLVDWVVDFIAPGKTHSLPNISDSSALPSFRTTMMFLNKEMGNGKAGYYLQLMGMDSDAFTTLVYSNYDPVITEPEQNDYVAFVEKTGYGGLRTGWDEGDLMLYIVGNNSAAGHGHYDQLSFLISTDDLWPAFDPGYSNVTGGFDEEQGHNIILVDGQWQTIKGNGVLKPVVEGQLYGQLTGSAPGAYAEGLLTQWDRHAIMINHNDRPYYIIIDEMASETERTFDFNLNTGGWKELTVDGKALTEGINQGNKVVIFSDNGYLFTEFVGKEKMNIEAVTYEDGGPVLQADGGKSKSQQYMTIMSKAYGIEVDEAYSFLQLLNTPDLVSYKTSAFSGDITKSVRAKATALYFFRGHKAGDWIELPFTLSETGTYNLVLKTAKSYNYGIYKVYIDGEYVATYDGYDSAVYPINVELGEYEVTAGEHIMKLELVGQNSMSIGTLISVASLTFAIERAMPTNPIYTQEVYDTDKVLGAKIFHTENNVDIVLQNRTTGKITAGGVTTTGEQAAIIGLMEDGYMEGFTVVAGTSLTFNGKTLVKASSAATVSADFRGKASYIVTTEKDQSISLYAPYEIVGATVDGKSVKYSVDGNVAKVSVPAGTHEVVLKVIGAVEYLWGHESGFGKVLYDENGEIIYKYWKDIDGTEYLYEDGQLKINAYFDSMTKVLIREELLEDGSWQVTTYDLIGNVNTIEIQHPNGNLTTITYQKDGSISTLITDNRGDYLEMTMDYPDGSKTVAQYLDDKTVTTKYGTNGNVLAVTTLYNDGQRVEETYDENGKLLSKITRAKGGNREEVVYNADGSVVTSVYTASKLTSVQTVNADGTSILEEYLEDGSVRVTKYDKDGNVLEVTINGKLVEEEKADNSWIIIVIVAVAVVGAAALVIVLVKIKKRNVAASAE